MWGPGGSLTSADQLFSFVMNSWGKAFSFLWKACLKGRERDTFATLKLPGPRELAPLKASHAPWEERLLCHQCRTHWWLSLVAEACLIVPLEAQLSPLGHLDSSLTSVPSLQSLFEGQGKASPLRSGCKLWDCCCGGWLDLDACEYLSETLRCPLVC